MQGNTRFPILLAVILLLASCSPAPEVSPAPESIPPPPAQADPIPCYLTSDPIEIDGRPDEAAWKQAPEIPLRFDGLGNPVAPTRASARFLWDGKDLYVAITAQDRDIGSTLSGRDARLWEEDVLELFIQPLESSLVYYEFEFSPTNQIFDAYWVKRGTPLDEATPWNSQLRVAVAAGRHPQSIRRTTTGAGRWNWPFPWPICITRGIPSRSRARPGRRQSAAMTMTSAGNGR